MFEGIKRFLGIEKPIMGKFGGAMPSEPDDRDIIKNVDRNNFLAKATTIPSAYSLSDKIGRILDQGSTNACTGFAGAYFMNILVNKTTETKSDYNLNPYFNYFYARLESGVSGDGGAYIRSALSAMYKYGTWCCDMDSTTDKIPSDFDKTLSFKLNGYSRVVQGSTVINDMKYILSIEKLPLYSGVLITDTNVNSYSGKIEAISSTYSAYTGGWHAMTITGYYEDGVGDTWFEVPNTWGKSWGDYGVAWIHEDYFKSTSFVSEVWSPIVTYY